MKTHKPSDQTNSWPTLSAQIGERIRDVRRQKKMSQAELARRAKMTQVSISQVERGCRKQFKEEVLARIAAVLDTPLSYLVAGVDASLLLNRLDSKLCRTLQLVAALPIRRQEEIDRAIRWLMEWRYGMPTSTETDYEAEKV